MQFIFVSQFSVLVYNALLGNGYCNDETNNVENNYDGGDCCGYDVNTENCIVCGCYHEETCLARVHPLVGDGYRNDLTNIAACNYDNGDCCGSCVIKKHCSDCKCLKEVSDIDYSNALLGDGICSDETNTAACSYDGGDCCGHNVNTDHCLQCKCYHQETCAADPSFHSYVGDGYCDDELNNPACMYDGLDCCGSFVNTEHCIDCKCHGKYF